MTPIGMEASPLQCPGGGGQCTVIRTACITQIARYKKCDATGLESLCAGPETVPGNRRIPRPEGDHAPALGARCEIKLSTTEDTEDTDANRESPPRPRCPPWWRASSCNALFASALRSRA